MFKGNSVMLLNRGTGIEIRGALEVVGGSLIDTTSTPYFTINHYEVIRATPNPDVPNNSVCTVKISSTGSTYFNTEPFEIDKDAKATIVFEINGSYRDMKAHLIN